MEKELNELLDDDEFFDDELIASIREKRMRELSTRKEELLEQEQQKFGTLSALKTDKQLLELTTSVSRSIVHFEKEDFKRCQIVNKHLEILAKKHYNCKFARVDVLDAPFIVDKLKIQMLPCIVIFKDGIAADRIVGFEELGNLDSFTTAQLETRLKQSGVFDVQIRNIFFNALK